MHYNWISIFVLNITWRHLHVKPRSVDIKNVNESECIIAFIDMGDVTKGHLPVICVDKISKLPITLSISII